ncbi:uncharacterized protein N7511_006495 [Penicillium nucicola]|uniref:uncharacterized protein n=1 Tax=Penicillium nucicola TaxID=1850975 RepID=UPI0025450588|nr:uncharacterized protein N7511_006495 [Penicillium nucicola]KAJ5757801.1 hypothetical protein N7511_006495 [Penicillium nucicola]
MHEAEYRSLEFFQLHTSLCFGKGIGSYILQAAYHEPIIRTIAVAIGALHNSFVFHDKGTASSRGDTSFTLLHYNKAIRQLIAMNPQTTPQTNDTFLVACILFFCFECLQGNYRLAIQHAISGLKIIKQHQSLATTHIAPRYIPQESVTLLFAILENQMLEIEGQTPLSSDLRPEVLSPPKPSVSNTYHLPSSTDEMRAHFEFLYNRFLRFQYVCEMLEDSTEERAFEFLAQAHEIQREYLLVRVELEAWIRTFDTWIKTVGTKPPEEANMITILQVWRLIMSLFLKLGWPPSEASWDNHTDHFSQINSLLSDLLGLPTTPDKLNLKSFTGNGTSMPSDSSTSSLSVFPPLLPKPSRVLPSTFSLSLGIVTPLYLCATRCRESYVRHRAIDLMLSCQRREGLWDAELAGRVAKRVVQIEENAAGIEPGADYTPIDIDYDARVRSLSPQYSQGREMRIRYHKQGGGSELVEEIVTW